MIEITETEKFNQVVSQAIESAIMNAADEAQARRWTNAITRAVTEIENNPLMSYDESAHSLLICSPSNNIYAANGVCQCVAFLEFNQPCWHRAAARLVRLYFEALKPIDNAPAPAAASVLSDYNSAPYIKSSSEAKAARIGGILI